MAWAGLTKGPSQMAGPFSSRFDSNRLALAHFTFAQEQPVDRDVLLERQRDQEVRVGCRPTLVSVDVLLKYAEIARELSL